MALPASIWDGLIQQCAGSNGGAIPCHLVRAAQGRKVNVQASLAAHPGETSRFHFHTRNAPHSALGEMKCVYGKAFSGRIPKKANSPPALLPRQKTRQKPVEGGLARSIQSKTMVPGTYQIFPFLFFSAPPPPGAGPATWPTTPESPSEPEKWPARSPNPLEPGRDCFAVKEPDGTG